MTDELNELREQLLSDLRVEMMAMHLGDDRLVGTYEAAELLDVSPRTVQRWHRDGKIGGVKTGKGLRMSLGQLRAFSRRVADHRVAV